MVVCSRRGNNRGTGLAEGVAAAHIHQGQEEFKERGADLKPQGTPKPKTCSLAKPLSEALRPQ